MLWPSAFKIVVFRRSVASIRWLPVLRSFTSKFYTSWGLTPKNFGLLMSS